MIVKYKDDLRNWNEQKFWHILDQILCRLNYFYSYFTNVEFYLDYPNIIKIPKWCDYYGHKRVNQIQ